MQEMLEATADIGDSSRKIRQIIGTIEDIAFQTNLLALNASVEAARAGDAGRGFSVITGEVRKLSVRITSTSKDTAKLIEDSLRAVENGAKIAEKSAAASEELSAQAQLLKELTGIFTKIKE